MSANAVGYLNGAYKKLQFHELEEIKLIIKDNIDFSNRLCNCLQN